MAPSTPIDVFDYLDYRAYLRDYYELKKAAGRGFSYRVFSRRAKLKSPNYLKLVIDGERNLSGPMAERFAEACGLGGEAAQHFVDLVGFNQAGTATERNEAYTRLRGSQHYREAHRLDVAHAAYYSAWYMPAIRELAAAPHFRADAAWIAAQLVPQVSQEEAAHALDTLLELQLLRRTDDGRVVQTDVLLSTGPETRGVHIATYHRTMMQQAVASMDLIPAAERDISSLTLCLNRGSLERYKERLQRFRRELLELSATEEEPEVVVQIGFQLFPLTTVRGKTGP